MRPIKEFNNARAQFMKLAAADDLPPILVKLAYLIAFQEINLKTQTTRRTHAAPLTWASLPDTSSGCWSPSPSAADSSSKAAAVVVKWIPSGSALRPPKMRPQGRIIRPENATWKMRLTGRTLPM
jgi:hypothetical protein